MKHQSVRRNHLQILSEPQTGTHLKGKLDKRQTSKMFTTNTMFQICETGGKPSQSTRVPLLENLCQNNVLIIFAMLIDEK